MKSKRIILISSLFPPYLDGVGDYTHQLGKTLEREYEVYYINQQVLAINHWNFKNWQKVYGRIKELKPDLVSLQYVPFSFHSKGLPFTLLFFWLRLKLSGFTLQITFHEVAIGFNKKSIRQNIGAALQRIIAWILCMLSEHIFTSVGLYYEMLKPFNKNTKQVFIGSNLPVYKKERINIGPIKICTFNNRINCYLLDTIKKLIDDGNNIKLVGIGKFSKEKFEKVKQYINRLDIEKNIEIIVENLDTELAYFLNESDIFVQMEWVGSKGEGGLSLKSGALMSAMGTGLPVISSFGKMTDHQFLNENHGILFTNINNSLYDALSRLIKNPNFRVKLGDKAFKFYNENFTWDNIASHYHELLND